ncbi:hypothetical protein DIPPA_16877 [Diplonema papillatum]|nr:hypothetical protein DIPPA_16877 [Diplonema papillatum]
MPVEVTRAGEILRSDDQPDAVCWVPSGTIVSLLGPAVEYRNAATGKRSTLTARAGEAATCVACSVPLQAEGSGPLSGGSSSSSSRGLPHYFAVGTAEGYVVLSCDVHSFPVETTRVAFTADTVSHVCMGRDAVGKDFAVAADVTGKLAKVAPWASRPQWSRRLDWERGAPEEYVRTFVCLLAATPSTPPLVCAVGNCAEASRGSDCLLLTTEGAVAGFSHLPFQVRGVCGEACCQDAQGAGAAFVAAADDGVYQVAVGGGEEGDGEVSSPQLLFELPCEPQGLVALPSVPCLVVNFGCGVSAFTREAGAWREAWAMDSESFVSDVCAYSPEGVQGFLASSCDGAVTAYHVTSTTRSTTS